MAWARGQFGNPEEVEHQPLEVGIRGLIQQEDLVRALMNCRLCRSVKYYFYLRTLREEHKLTVDEMGGSCSTNR
jgi:hypothetical protein